MKTMIYRAFSLMLFCLALVSCKDDFDIQKLQDHSRLVVYCFPTEGDTTLVSVAKSLPVASVKGNVDILSREKVDAHIIYKVNGVEQTVKRIANEEEAQLFTSSTEQIQNAPFTRIGRKRRESSRPAVKGKSRRKAPPMTFTVSMVHPTPKLP